MNHIIAQSNTTIQRTTEPQSAVMSRGNEVGPAQFIDASGVRMPLRAARAYAMALLTGCEAIEATP